MSELGKNDASLYLERRLKFVTRFRVVFVTKADRFP